MRRCSTRLALILGLLGVGAVRGQDLPYPYFPPPGMSYSAATGNLTLENLTLSNITGIVMANGGTAVSAANAANVIALWTGTPSAMLFLRSDGQLATAGAGTVTSVAITVPAPLTATGCTITVSGTCAITWTAAQTANQFLATPNGSSGPVGLRAIAAADLPGSFAGFANPTGSVGLTAVNGTATTAMRSDAAPVLNTAISPTMTGTWLWSNPSNQVAIFKTSTAGDFAEILAQGSSSAAEGGICTSTTAALCQSNEAANDVNLFYTGTLHVSNITGRDVITASAAGNIAVPAPSSGTPLTTTSANGLALELNSTDAGVGAYLELENSGTAFGFLGSGALVGGSSTDTAVRSQGGLILATGGANTRVTLFNTGGVTIGTPTGGDCGSACLNVATAVEVNGVPLAAGQFASVSASCTGSGCTASNPHGISSSISRNSQGSYTVTFSPAFAAAPNCTATQVSNFGTIQTSSSSTTGVTVGTGNAAGSPIDIGWTLICSG